MTTSLDRAAAGPRRLFGLLGVLGAATGLLLWWLYQREDESCSDLGACLAPFFTAIVATVVVGLILVVVLWRARVEQPLLTPLVALGVGVGLLWVVLGTARLAGADPRPAVGWWWLWLVIGALALPVGHWFVRPESPLLPKIVLAVVVIAGMVLTERLGVRADRADELRRFELVGADQLVIPQVPDHEPLHARVTTTAQEVGEGGRVPHIVIDYSAPEGGSYPDAELARLGDSDPCELMRAVVPTLGPGGCTPLGSGYSASSERRIAVAEVRGQTLVVVSADPGRVTRQQLAEALRQARPATAEELADL